MTRIKICGITTREDALTAIEYGADALGFIAVPGSPRYVPSEVFDEIAFGLPPLVKRVAVVRKPEDADGYAADLIQHYADTLDKSRSRRDSQWRVRAFRMEGEQSLREIEAYPETVGAILLDAYHKDKLGGSGETFDWKLAQEAKRLTDKPVILAGGLTPDNVQAALEAVRPYAVDVSSGVEASPGVKDYGKLKAFIQAVRGWDWEQNQ